MLSFHPHEQKMTRSSQKMRLCAGILLIFPPGFKYNRTTSNKGILHFIIYISGALQLAPDGSCEPGTAAARIPLAGTPDTDFWRARAQEAAYVLRGVCARARGRVSWKHRPSVFTQARSRPSPAVQSARTWKEGGLCWACAECGSGVRLINNVSEFISASKRSLWRSSPAARGPEENLQSAWGECAWFMSG